MTTIDQLEAKIKSLAARVTELEDERELRELLARYGYNADVCRDEEYIDLYTDDGIMNLGDTLDASDGTRSPGIRRWEGKVGLTEFIKDPKGHSHPDAYGKRMHVQGNNVACHIKGDEAIVNSYSIVLLRKGDDVALVSAGNNEWAMRKVNGKWHIKERIRRHIGGEEYHGNLEATPA